MDGEGLDQWRSFFLTASASIFEVIENGIMVAAKDCPEEFKLKRGNIAEKLYSCQFAANSAGCACVELSTKKNGRGITWVAGGSNGDVSKAHSGQMTNDDGAGRDHAMTQMKNRNDPKGKAKAVQDENQEVEEEDKIVGEVLKIKELITSCQNESPETVLFDALKRLQLMPISVKILKVTMVGKAVNDLRKCSSKQICQLAKTLIGGWQVVVDQWVSAMEAVAAMEAAPAMEAVSVVTDEGSAADSNPRVVDEKELPSLPLNDKEFPSLPWSERELLFVPMRAVSTDYLKSFFDGLDEDGNLISSTEVNRGERMKQVPGVKPIEVPKINLPTTNLGPSRRVKPSAVAKLNNETKTQKKSDKYATPTRKRTGQLETLNGSSEAAILGEPEAIDPKLEIDQQTENAKRTRIMRFMDFYDVPKQTHRSSPRSSRRRNQPSL